MLETIGVDAIDDLFDEIPGHLRAAVMEAVPQGMTEMDISRLMRQRADENTKALCFLGAGAYQHQLRSGKLLPVVNSIAPIPLTRLKHHRAPCS